ncbi:MAG TPA: ribose-phosphate diphosphokinase [Gemmataceae bacterium]|nr:ribose-phosphate diphosphokinase [Gemmataceae bacterium]
MSVLLVSTVSSEPFARRLAGHLGVPLSAVERRQFPDGERYLRFEVADRFGLLDRDVVIVGATDGDAGLADVYRLASEAGRCGARSLNLVVPYFGYSTMERAVHPGEVVTAEVIARQLSGIPRAARGNRVLLMDLHAAGIVHYFGADTVALELYAESKIVAAVRALNLPRLCLASTDMGRAKWVEALANKLAAPIALIHKHRLSGSETRVSAVVGDVAGRNVVIYDDMIRTGGTLLQAAGAYLKAGAASVHAAATHLVLPPGTVERIEASPLGKVIGTDTHPNHRLVEGRPRFEVVSVADLFADVVARLLR